MVPSIGCATAWSAVLLASASASAMTTPSMTASWANRSAAARSSCERMTPEIPRAPSSAAWPMIWQVDAMSVACPSAATTDSTALAEEGFLVLAGPLGDSESFREHVHRALLIVDAESEGTVRARLAADRIRRGMLKLTAVDRWEILLGEITATKILATSPG